MDALAVKPSTNGTIKISRRGIVKFEFEDGRPFELDVVAVHDDYVALDWSFRDIENKIPKEKFQEWNRTTHDFWQACVNDAYAKASYDPGAPALSRGETDALHKLVVEEVKKLNDFFLPKKDEPSSLPTSTEAGTQIRFSQ